MERIHGIWSALIGTLALGAISTLFDLFWALYIPQHQMIYGLIHGALLCMLLGLILGFLVGPVQTALQGAMGELVIGLVASGGFYALYGLLGWGAMFVSWMVLWLLTALLLRWLRGRVEGGAAKNTDQAESLGVALLRGTVAAILSGLAFYAISDIWLQPPAEPNYFYFFACWSFAFLPGFLALFVTRQSPATDSE